MDGQEMIPGVDPQRGFIRTPPKIPDLAQEYHEGWRDLVARAHAELLEVCPDYEAHQVKTKFGGLRLYIAGNEAAFEVVEKYEQESYTVCELCGAPGSVDTSRHWTMTLCDADKAARAPNGTGP